MKKIDNNKHLDCMKKIEVTNIKTICKSVGLSALKDFKCLEIGAGKASFSRVLKQMFPKSQITLLDKTFSNIPRKIKEEFNNNLFTLVKANAENIPLKSHSFDIIIAYNFFRHCTEEQISSILRECYRLIKHNGKLCVIDNSPDVKKKSEQVMKNIFLLEADIDSTSGNNPENYFIMDLFDNLLNIIPFKIDFFEKDLKQKINKYSEQTQSQIIEHLQKQINKLEFKKIEKFNKQINEISIQIKNNGITPLNKFLLVLKKEEISGNCIPIISPKVVWREETIGQNSFIIIYDKSIGMSKLNTLGSFIWEQCDGTKTIKDISNNLFKTFSNEEYTRLLSDVSYFIFTLINKGFLTSNNF